jgi:hypothetical protein
MQWCCCYSYALNDVTEWQNVFVPSPIFFYNVWPKTMNGASAINIALYAKENYFYSP